MWNFLLPWIRPGSVCLNAWLQKNCKRRQRNVYSRVKNSETQEIQGLERQWRGNMTWVRLWLHMWRVKSIWELKPPQTKLFGKLCSLAGAELSGGLNHILPWCSKNPWKSKTFSDHLNMQFVKALLWKSLAKL